MKIAPINSANISMKAKWNKKQHITNDLLTAVNKKMLETNGKKKGLSPLDKFADFMLNKDVVKTPKELLAAEKEFNSLPKQEQDKILLYAKCRKNSK